MDKIETLCNDLDQILCSEIEVYQHILELENASKQILTSAALEPILYHLQIKERLSKRAREFDYKRQQVLIRLADCLHLLPLEVTLNRLGALAPQPYAERFVNHRRALQQLVLQLQQCRQSNAVFLKDALTLINHALSYFRHVFPTHMTYGQSGTSLHQPHGHILSERI